MNKEADCRIVCISGIDGCGKTSIIEALRKNLEDGGHPTRYVWLRYNHYLTKLLLVFCRIVGLTRYEYPDGVRVGYHDFHRSKIVSWLFIFLTYIDTLIVSCLLVYLPMLLKKNSVLICDRWLLDIMVDLEVDTGIEFLEEGWLERLFRTLLPARARCFLVMRDKEAVLAVRPENVRDDNFPRRWDLYQSLASRTWVTVIDNNSTIDDAVEQVAGHIAKGG